MATKLKWQRITDSDGTTIFYTAVAGQPEPRQPYRSYRISPVIGLHSIDTVVGWGISMWQGERQLPVEIGSIKFRYGRGEFKLADAKRAAQDHHNNQAGA